jgi:hypothetical protein
MTKINGKVWPNVEQNVVTCGQGGGQGGGYPRPPSVLKIGTPLPKLTNLLNCALTRLKIASVLIISRVNKSVSSLGQD